MSGDEAMRAVYLLVMAASVGAWVLVEYRQQSGQALRVAMAWGMIFVGVAAGYGLWHDLRRDIRPDQMVGADRVEIPRAEDGHYYLRLEVNGRGVEFMADTGASGIVLSPEDAAALGFDPAGLQFLGQADTANGVVRTARVRLDKVVFGPFEDRDVGAFVNQAEMAGSLLGMDYLGRFAIQISGERMVLTR